MSPKTSPQESNLLVSLEEVSLYRRTSLVLENITFKIHYDEIVTLIGPNGAGKSTLARLILGLIKPSHGLIWRKPHIRIGYVPQRLVIPKTLALTVERLLTLTRGYDKTSMRSVLQECGVEYVFPRDVHTLSGGELQRVLLARALLHKPSLMILDEPMQNIDVNGQNELYELLWGLRDRHHCGILLISHDLHIVMAKTNWVICLNRHICCAGYPEEINQNPQYTALFGDHPKQALGFYTHHHLGHRHGLDQHILPFKE